MVEAQTRQGFNQPEDENLFVSLGFVDKPRNQLITKAQFTPSKIGGKPAWIAPEIPEEQLTCERCSTPFCFIAQVYANLNHMPDHHRMLYLFACISPQCIKRSDSVRAFRGVQHDRNSFVTFANEEDYNFAFDKADASLRTSRLANMYDDDQEDGDQNDESHGSDSQNEDSSAQASTMIDTGDKKAQ